MANDELQKIVDKLAKKKEADKEAEEKKKKT